MARRATAAPPATNGHGPPQALTASGQRLSKTKLKLEVQSPGWIARAREWQTEVIDYADALGVIGYGVGQMAGAMGKARWFIATRENPQDEPVDAMEANVAEADLAFAQLQRLTNSPQGLAGITAVGAWNWQVPGEYYVVGEGTGDGLGTSEQWDVRSVKEITSVQRLDPESEQKIDVFSITEDIGMQPRELDPNDSFVSRLHRRHPIYGRQATSYMRALRTECDEYLILSRSIRGSGRSRSNNGLLLFPNGLTISPLSVVDDATPGRGTLTMGDQVMDALLLPVADEGSAASVVPVMLQGDGDLLDKVRHVPLDRAIDPIAAAQRAELIQRINEGMNWPVEIGTGIGAANHWSAWAITESMFDSHVAPELTLMAQSLWTGVVRPLFIEALVGEGKSEETAREIASHLFIWYDGSGLISKPNVVSDIIAAANAQYPIVNDEFARKALGASEEDKPTEQYLALRAAYIAATAGKRLGATIPGEDIGPPPALPAPEAPGTPPRAVVTAAARPRRSKLAKLGPKLAAIDRALFARLEAAASAALTRALEKAGNRVKSRAQRNGATKAVVASGVPAVDVIATLGPSMVASLGFAEPDLLDGEFDDIAARFDTWAARAQRQALQAVADANGVSVDELDDVSTEQDNRRHEAVGFLSAGLATLAAARLYDPHPAAPPLGEHDSTMSVPPGLIREAMAKAGGAGGVADADGPTGGVATGPNIRDYLSNNGTAQTGWEWSYGDSEREFPPHVDLDGESFADWDDPKLAAPAGYEWVDGGIPGQLAPGDHDFCRCIAEPLYDEGSDQGTEVSGE